MSGAAIVRALLANRPEVLALVPAGRIFAGVVPQAEQMPAISVMTISETENETTARRLRLKMIRERVQVTVYTKNDYPLLKRLMKAAALGPGVHTATVVGFQVRSVLPWGAGPEIPPADDKIHEQSRDFMVTFVEAN